MIEASERRRSMAGLKTAGHTKENMSEVENEIRAAAEIIFNFLYHEGEITIEQLKEKAGRQAPFFDWGIGWLVGKGDNEIVDREGSFSVRRKAPAPAVIPL